MKFFDFPASYRYYEQIMGIKDPLLLYEVLLRQTSLKSPVDESAITAHNQWLTEHDWIKSGKPYYNIWPGIVPHLCRLRDDKVPISYVKLPLKALAFRFAEKDEFFRFDWEGKQYQLKTALVGDYRESIGANNQKVCNEGVLTLWMDWGEQDFEHYPVFLYRTLVLREGIMVDEAQNLMQDHPSASLGMQVPHDLLVAAVRCVISCCLISQK
jgi:hypothetical protein